MNVTQELLLGALGAALKNEQVAWSEELSPRQWQDLFHMAQIHRVLPMVFQAVYACPAAEKTDGELLRIFRRQSMQQVALQARRSAQLLPVLEALRAAGIRPLVVKGIVCRSLYPAPDLRLSSDEDILVPRENFADSCRVLENLGLQSQGGTEEDYEITFIDPTNGQRYELHQSLFPPEHDAYGDLNRFFSGVHEHPVEMGGIPTLPPTEHLLYLILHAYKHFLHSGFGIRQVCDLAFCANAWGRELDWLHILDCCCQVRAEKFAAALFAIGEKYLNFLPEGACYPARWREIQVDEGALLEDILCAGVYGNADMSRKHSSNITLQAVAARDKKGSAHGLRKSLFPPAKDLEGRYPYLKGKPFLLPVAWAQRILRYSRETAGDSSPAQSIRIGNARVALMKQYGILND